MNRFDHAVVGGLVLLLAVIAVVIGAPAILPQSPVSPSSAIAASRTYREGVLGRAMSVSPLSAKTQVDRDLVALTYSGLVRLGPDGRLLPDLADHWDTSSDGKTWTFVLRPDASWHDGQPVTADDVVFTVRTLQDPAYTGPGAGSWSEVSARAVDGQTVRFDLATPLGGFLELARQPIAPAHVYGDIPVGDLGAAQPDTLPVGSGPFAVVELDDVGASLEPAALVAAPAAGDPGAPLPTDTVGGPAATGRPSRPVPYLPRLEFRFYDDPTELADAFRNGDLDAASGLSTATAADLADAPGARLLRYPGTTLTTIALNLRPNHPAFRDPGVRTALLEAIDRSTAINGAWEGLATPAAGLVPPTSWAFDAASSVAVPFDRTAATAALQKAGWKLADGKWTAVGGNAPLTIEILGPNRESSPSLAAVADAVAADWRAFGIDAKRVDLGPGETIASRLHEAKFDVAVVDLAIGQDPDLYPLLASSQTRTGGLNVIGFQDPGLDRLLAAARAPGTPADRTAAYAAVQAELAKSRPLLPVAFADELVVVRDDLQGPVVRPVADPSDRFWDVLTWRLAADR
jgi:peptide/nickel transport system substrate-binding protein